MQPTKRQLLLHPVFLSALILLLLNDHWGKYAFHNWITGKLSDFTGVLVLAIFLYAITPLNKLYSILITVLLFAWWKTPLSQPFISWLQDYWQLPVNRIIDYSDFAAFSILPLLYYIYPLKPLIPKIAGLLKNAVILATVFSIMATTVPYRYFHYTEDGYVKVYKEFKTRLEEKEILGKLDSLGYHYYIDSVQYFPVEPDRYFLRIQQPGDSVSSLVPLKNFGDTTLYFIEKKPLFYCIPQYIVEKDTLRNISFTIGDNGRKRIITILSMYIDPRLDSEYYFNKSIRKKYNAMVKTFLLE